MGEALAEAERGRRGMRRWLGREREEEARHGTKYKGRKGNATGREKDKARVDKETHLGSARVQDTCKS